MKSLREFQKENNALNVKEMMHLCGGNKYDTERRSGNGASGCDTQDTSTNQKNDDWQDVSCEKYPSELSTM